MPGWVSATSAKTEHILYRRESALELAAKEYSF